MSKHIIQTERKHYEAAVAAVAPISALRNRVLVIQIREEDELVKDDLMSIPGLQGRSIIQKGGLYIPAEAKKTLKENEVVKALIKSIGPAVREDSGLHVNDLVLVFPSIFETLIKMDGLDYFVYGEADLIAKFEETETEDIYDHSRMD